MEQITHLPIEALRESPSNPRRTFPKAELAELADSIAAQGVLQPIIVRPIVHPDDPTPGRAYIHSHEIVFGHRRFRATELAGLDTIPTIVRAMTDDQVALAQLAENMNREDVSALEEADAMRRMVDEMGISVDTLMSQTGKSRSYVYSRLKLASAGGAVRNAIQQGLSPEAALLVARMPDAVQPVAVTRLQTTSATDGGVVWHSFRQTKQVLGNLTTKTDGFEWPMDFVQPGCSHAGGTSCAECLHNTSNAPELAEALGAGVCTMTECAGQRREAWRLFRIEAARGVGRLIEGEEKEALNRGFYPTAYIFGDHYAATFPVWSLVKRAVPTPEHVHVTLADASDALQHNPLRSSDCPTPRLLEMDHWSGHLVELFCRDDALKLATAYAESMGIELMPEPASTPSTAARGEDRSAPERPDQRVELTPEQRAVTDPYQWSKVRSAMARAALSRGRTRDDLMLMAHEAVLNDLANDETWEILGWSIDASLEPVELWSELDVLSNDKLADLLVVICILGMTAPSLFGMHHGYRDSLMATARLYGVDVLTAEIIESSPTMPPAAAENQSDEADTSGAGGDLDEEERDTLTRDIFEAHPDALPAAEPPHPATARPLNRPVAYRNQATGESWSGRGLKPRWLAVALESGRTLAEFEVRKEGATA